MQSSRGSLICLSIFTIATAVEVMESELNYIIIGVIRPKKNKKEKNKAQHFFLCFFADPCVFRFGKWSGLPVLYGVAKFYLMGRQTVLDAAYSSAGIQALTLAR